MAYNPHYRIQWGGSIYDSTTAGAAVEVWSNTLSLAATGGYDPATGIDAIADAIGLFHANTNTNIDKRCALEFVKVNQIGSDGKYVNPITNQVTRNVRGFTTGAQIMQASLRVSLDDGTRNRRAKGGFYIPCWAAAPTTDWRLTTTVQSNLMLSVQQLLADLNGPNAKVCIASSVAGALTVVTRARIGRRPDVIRTRGNALSEGYLVGAVNPSL